MPRSGGANGEPMTSFDARLKLSRDTGLPLGVDIDLTTVE